MKTVVLRVRDALFSQTWYPTEAQAKFYVRNQIMAHVDLPVRDQVWRQPWGQILRPL
jgi:hypothetical protein